MLLGHARIPVPPFSRSGAGAGNRTQCPARFKCARVAIRRRPHIGGPSGCRSRFSCLRGRRLSHRGRMGRLAAGLGIEPSATDFKGPFATLGARVYLAARVSVDLTTARFRALPARRSPRVELVPAGWNRTSVHRLQGDFPTTGRCWRWGDRWNLHPIRLVPQTSASLRWPRPHLEFRPGTAPGQFGFAIRRVRLLARGTIWQGCWVPTPHEPGLESGQAAMPHPYWFLVLVPPQATLFNRQVRPLCSSTRIRKLARRP